jgi:hypothetical protein
LAEHLLRGRIALAEHDGPQARAEFSGVVGERRPNGSTVFALLRRAEAGLQEGRLDLALQDARDAVALGQKLQGGQPASVRTGLARLLEGRVLDRQGEAALARESYREAQRHLGVTVDTAHPALAQLKALLGG